MKTAIVLFVVFSGMSALLFLLFKLPRKKAVSYLIALSLLASAIILPLGITTDKLEWIVAPFTLSLLAFALYCRAKLDSVFVNGQDTSHFS